MFYLEFKKKVAVVNPYIFLIPSNKVSQPSPRLYIPEKAVLFSARIKGGANAKLGRGLWPAAQFCAADKRAEVLENAAECACTCS